MTSKMKHVFAIVSCIISIIYSKLVTLSNTETRKDTNGNIMDAHDGNIIQWNGTGDYFYYSLGYGSCEDIYIINNDKENIYCQEFMKNSSIENQICGFQYNQSINLFVSSDLKSWKYYGNILPIDTRPYGIYLSPTVTYNPNTNEYILYCGVWSQPTNHSSFNSQYMAATSKSKYGPFKIINTNVNLTNPKPGDAKLFTDDNGKGYLIYTSMLQTNELNHSIVVELLTDNYLYSTGIKSEIFPQSGQQLETPTLFKNIYNGLYYATASHICCYCTKGSIVMVFISNNILGTYKQMKPTPYINDINQNGNDNNNTIIIHAQQTNIFETKILNNKNKIEYKYIWIGNRWQSSPDGTKG
eukprot:364290_1